MGFAGHLPRGGGSSFRLRFHGRRTRAGPAGPSLSNSRGLLGHDASSRAWEDESGPPLVCRQSALEIHQAPHSQLNGKGNRRVARQRRRRRRRQGGSQPKVVRRRTLSHASGFPSSGPFSHDNGIGPPSQLGRFQPFVRLMLAPWEGIPTEIQSTCACIHYGLPGDPTRS
ncbi:hypothetical protein LY76DRAFT_237812 [Colletotrichum caudatum]|nr:hypothetical protein LY76DRAFT_237812 [Colletotrichum caudatum]